MKRPLCPKCGVNTMHRGSKAPSGKVRWTCTSTVAGDRTICYQTTNPNAPYRGRNKPKEPEKVLVFDNPVKKKKLLITWAQNATPIQPKVLASFLVFCKEEDAQLMVIPGRYKNPTSKWEESQLNEQWWDKAVVPYLVNTRLKVNSNLVLLADIKTQPTATQPLSGFESITHGESGILGHPKLQMTVIPTPHQRLPKIMTTTGAVTVANYTDTKAGKKGDFHHVYGAVVVDLDGNQFIPRHVNVNGKGEFCDLDKMYTPDGVKPAGPYKALIFGDTHVAFTDPTVDGATFGKGGLVQKLNPETLVFHDLLDSYAVNPHHMNRPFIAVAKRRAKMDNMRDEVYQACAWLNARAYGRQTRIIASNHNDFFSRWMDRCDWREDPENAEFYLETALHMVRTATMSATGARTKDPFQFWAERHLSGFANIKCVGRNESLMIAGIECSLHGDQGPSGTRGSRANLSKIGVKTVIGHTHTPGITEGCYQAGTSTPLSLEYTGAVGSWLNAHVSIDPLGKRHIHIMINGKFWF